MDKKALIITVLLMMISSATSAQEPSNKRFAQWLWKDPGVVVKGFGAEELAGTAFSGITLGLLSNYDQSTTDRLQSKYEGSPYLKIVNEVGTISYVAPASAGVFGLTLLTDNYKLQDAAFTSFQSVINTVITVNILKFVVARGRPVQEEGSRDLDFFQLGHSSFPSGHTSTAFALVVPWVMYYPSPATVALLGIPVSTAVSRIVEGRHWLTDVTAGAIIGSYWGYTLARKHKHQQFSNIAMTPFVLGDGGGLNLKISF